MLYITRFSLQRTGRLPPQRAANRALSPVEGQANGSFAFLPHPFTSVSRLFFSLFTAPPLSRSYQLASRLQESSQGSALLPLSPFSFVRSLPQLATPTPQPAPVRLSFLSLHLSLQNKSATMLSASTSLPLALLATLSTVTASSFNSPHGSHGHAIRRAPSHHWSRSNLPGRVNSSRPRMARRGSSDEPSTLSEGSFTAAEGCTQWYHVSAGDSCYSAIATVAGGLPLDEFYAMNPQINEDCFNLWAGFDYCVARTTTSSSSSSPSTKAVVNNAVVHAVKTTSSQTTTTAAPATSTAAVVEEEDEDCDVEEEEYASSTAAPVRAAVAQTTTAAPATSTDDSAAKAAASKSSADAAWASSSKSSADAAWASSSKAAADAAWASSSSKAAAEAVKTTSSAPAETTKVADVSGNANSKLSAMGISTFLGEQTNAIASWFRTNSAQDSTNGNSWCYRKYDDSMVGFAPSLKTMTASFGGDPIAAGKAFCGLYADVSTPDGKTVKMMIVDAFDDSWVLTPSSIDVTYGSFHLLFGKTTDNKNDVVQGVTWKLTGERNPDYVFNNGNPV